MPSAQSSSRHENFVSTSKNLLKNCNWSFSIVRYFTWKLEFVSNILWMIEGVSGTKVPRLNMCRSIISLSKTTHQMWHCQSFSKRNKATKRLVGVEVGDKRWWWWWWGWTKFKRRWAILGGLQHPNIKW